MTGIVAALSAIVPLFLSTHPTSPAELQRQWLTEIGEGLRSGDLRTRSAPWKPVNIQRAYLQQGSRCLSFAEADRTLCEAAGLKADTSEGTGQIYRFTDERKFDANLLGLRQENRESAWLAVELSGGYFYAGVSLRYWPAGKKIPDAEAAWGESALNWYFKPLAISALLLGVLSLIRRGVNLRFRKALKKEWEHYKAGYDREVSAVLDRLERAERTARNGDVALALHDVNYILQANPGQTDALNLQRRLAEWRLTGVLPQDSALPAESGITTEMYLKLMGTPYAWLAPAGKRSIVIGRQRREGTDVDTEDSTGSDVVVRIPGDDDRTALISRRHLRLHRFNDDWYVTDLSKRGTKMGDTRLKRDVPERIQAGSRLTLADVLTLEVQFRRQISGRRVGDLIEVDAPAPTEDAARGGNKHPLRLEASVGDWITEVKEDGPR